MNIWSPIKLCSGAGMAQQLCNGLPYDGPGFNSWWERCKNWASHPLQGTVNGGAVSKWPRCQWDVKHNQLINCAAFWLFPKYIENSWSITTPLMLSFISTPPLLYQNYEEVNKLYIYVVHIALLCQPPTPVLLDFFLACRPVALTLILCILQIKGTAGITGHFPWKIAKWSDIW